MQPKLGLITAEEAIFDQSELLSADKFAADEPSVDNQYERLVPTGSPNISSRWCHNLA